LGETVGSSAPAPGAAAEPWDADISHDGLRLDPLGPSDRALLAGDPIEVAPALIGLVLVSRTSDGAMTAGRIVEVEAYRGVHDPASHAYRGPSARNRTMFGRAGLLYVYLSYGMHHCCNVVCEEEGVAGAVLLRALEPLAGLREMHRRRAARRRSDRRPLRDTELCSGPGRLCAALGIGRSHDGADLLAPVSQVRLARLRTAEAAPGTSATDRSAVTEPGHGPRLEADGLPLALARGPRVGISPAGATASEPWRWWLAGNSHVSRVKGTG